MSGASAVEDIVKSEYEHGFVDRDRVRYPAARSGRGGRARHLRAQGRAGVHARVAAARPYRHWLTMTEPEWAAVHYPPIDFQSISYFSAPKSKDGPKSLDEIDPALLETYNKLGIPIEEQMALAGIAVDAVFDSVSVATTFRTKLAEAGVIFCAISEAVHDYPDLVKQYLGSVVPHTDNYLRGAQCRGLQRRDLRLCPQGRALPHGAEHLFPHQCPQHRPVRAHPDRRRGGQLRQLSGGLHRPHARREPAPRRGGGADRHGRRRDQILHGPELVSRATPRAAAASTTS